MSERAIVSNKSYRELLETRNVFADPAYCREAWKSVGQAILLSPAIGCIGDIDTRDGSIEAYTYRKLTEELKDIGRKPTELEMIFHCQAARARFDTSAAVFVRDTVGAKPIDESKVTVGRSQYEEMSDDELEALLRYRQQRDGGKTYTVEATDPTVHTADPEPNGSSIADAPTATIADADGTTTADDTTADDTTAPIADTEGDQASTIAPTADTADTADDTAATASTASTVDSDHTASIADNEEQA